MLSITNNTNDIQPVNQLPGSSTIVPKQYIIRAYNFPRSKKAHLKEHDYQWNNGRRGLRPHFYKIVPEEKLKLEIRFLSFYYDFQRFAAVQPCLLDLDEAA